MLDPRSLYTINRELWESAQAEHPVLIHLLDGYVDAGGVTHSLSEHILLQCEHDVLAEFDVDQLHDYRSRRPSMTFDTNQWVDSTMPRLSLHRAVDAAGRPFLLLAGPEPDTQWARAVTAVVGLASELRVDQLVTASGVPMAVPHTRPTLITTHSTEPHLATGNPIFIDRIQVPGSFASLLEVRAGEAGLLAGGFVAHVPHYLAQGTYTPAATAVLTRVNGATGLAIPLEPLSATVTPTLEALAGEVDADSDLPGMVAALEEQYDELRAQGGSAVPTADEIGAAVERFLAEQDNDEG